MEFWMWKAFSGLGVICSILHWGEDLPYIRIMAKKINPVELTALGVAAIFLLKTCGV